MVDNEEGVGEKIQILLKGPSLDCPCQLLYHLRWRIREEQGMGKWKLSGVK